MKKFSIKKAVIIFIIFYAFLFLAGGLIAPVLAHFKFFEQADFLYILLHKSCHQEAMRCFWILGYQTALCARCLGAYAGVILYLIFCLFNFKTDRHLFGVVTFVAFGEILLEIFKVTAANNYIRFFSGICLGIFLAIVLTKLLYKNQNQNEREINV